MEISWDTLTKRFAPNFDKGYEKNLNVANLVIPVAMYDNGLEVISKRFLLLLIHVTMLKNL